MYCSKCGAQIADGTRFCNNCGNDVYGDANAHNFNTAQQAQNINASGNAYFQNHGSSAGNPGWVKNPVGNNRSAHGKTNMLTAVLAVILLCVVTVGAAFAVFYATDSWIFSDDSAPFVGAGGPAVVYKDTTETEPAAGSSPAVSEPVVTPPATVPESKVFDIGEIENYISANTSSGNVAVSVIDNKTGKKYNTGSAFSVYSAWGFYLPIYLLWPSEGIMSSDPGVCNSAANNAIEYLGGTASVTSLLRNNYSLTSTTYGRKFGDTTSVADNFTSSSDAVYLLSVLYSRGESTRLCYDYSKFGVSAPAGSTMYAQVGTENIGRKEKLNVFAIIKGASSNYCVAVLTEGYNSSLITPILGKIHNQMESL